MRSISTINPVIMESTDSTIVKADALVIDIKVGVSPLHRGHSIQNQQKNPHPLRFL